jgi:hypothetical protein
MMYVSADAGVGNRRLIGHISCAALILGALLACRKPEKPKDWDEHPLEPGHFLIEIGGSSDSDVWVVSNDNLHHFDGSAWTTHPLAMRKLSVVALGDAWFGGYMGTATHWDGKKFETFPIEAAKKKYWDVASISAWPGEVWVSFNQQGYFRREGNAAWEHVDPAALIGWKILTLWGKTKTDVWAAVQRPGEAKVAHLRDGTWTIIDRPLGLGFAGSATNDVWFMGNAAMVHWDGAKLTDHPLPEPNARLYGVASSSPNDALVVGPKGIAMRWNGARWNTLPNVGGYDLNRAFSAPRGRHHLIFQGSVLVRNTP